MGRDLVGLGLGPTSREKLIDNKPTPAFVILSLVQSLGSKTQSQTGYRHGMDGSIWDVFPSE